MKLPNILPSAVLCLVCNFTVNAQYFAQPGTFTYSLNSVNQVIDISPDGRIGIALKNDPTTSQSAKLTAFDPISGQQIDSETFGFGPLGVQLAQVGSNLRVIVLTSEGGPCKIYVFDMSSAGQLTALGSTQLTTSIARGSSNLVLSGSSQTGFVVVHSNTGADLVSFNLNTGAIRNRFHLPEIAGTLVMNEAPGRRLLAFRLDTGTSLRIVNALNPDLLADAGSVELDTNGESSWGSVDGIAFNADGRYVFFGNQFFNFAAIDLTVMQVVGTIPGNFRFSRVKMFANSQQQLLAAQSTPSTTNNGVSAILLIDVTDPANLSIINQYNFTGDERFTYKSDFSFSQDGSRLFVATPEKLIGFSLPGFGKTWERLVPGSSLREHQVKVYGAADEVIGAWDINEGSGFTAIFGAFPGFPPNVSVAESATVSEASPNADLTISLSAPTAHQVTVSYSTVGGTAQTGSDFTATTGSVVFEPNITARTISVPILNDVTDEFDETLSFGISNPIVALLGGSQNTLTILDDDSPPAASINSVSINEGNSGTTNANFSASLSAASGKPVSLKYATAADSATADLDYLPADGAITFSPGQTTVNVLIAVKGDTLNEDNESFFVKLTNPVNVTIAGAQGVGTIIDDDAPVLETEQNTQRAIALSSVTFLRDPFSITTPHFGTDSRTRIMLFTSNLSLRPGLTVTARAEDSLQTNSQLPVEFVASVPGLGSLSQIVVKLPDEIVNAGDLRISITVRGRTSNQVLVGVIP